MMLLRAGVPSMEYVKIKPTHAAQHGNWYLPAQLRCNGQILAQLGIRTGLSIAKPIILDHH